MKKCLVIACLLATTAMAQTQFFSPADLIFLDSRYALWFPGSSNAVYLSLVTNVTADTTTITNNGSGQFSVKNYDTNAIARTIYLRNNRDRLIDYQPGHVNAATLGEMTNGGPMAQTLSQLHGP